MSGDRETSNLLRNALDQFEEKILPVHRQRLQAGSELELKYECIRIQREQERRSALTNLRRIEQFIFRLRDLEALVKEICDGQPYINYIWGTMQFLLSTASNTLRDGSDGLLSAYEEIGNVIPNLKGLAPLFRGPTGLKECLVDLFSDILSFHSEAYRCFTQFSEKGRKKIFKSAWDDFKINELPYLKATIEYHKPIVDYGRQCLASQQYIDRGRNLSPDQEETLRREVLGYAKSRREKGQEHVREESKRRKDQFKTALEWILAGQEPDEKTHGRFCKMRKEFPKTCEWIDEIDTVGKWLSEATPDHPTLWITGSMGAGKSTLASYLIEKCKESIPTRPPLKATYFYCKENDENASTWLHIARGLLYRQLLHIEEDEKFKDLIAHCCDKKGNHGQKHLTLDDPAESLLKTFFEIIPDQFIVLDGLDECERPVVKEAVKVLTSVVTQQEGTEPGSLRLLILSRELNDIKKPLSVESAKAATFKIEAKHNEDAITLYVQQRLAKFDTECKLIDERKKKIVDKILHAGKGAKGMFLFARLTLDDLENSGDWADLNDRLEEDFPETINAAYDRLLERIKSSLNDDRLWIKARRIFGWLTCSARTLHWHEIRAIASIERHNESVELQERGFIHDVQRFCGTLVYVNPGNKVELIHHTARTSILESKHIKKQEVQFDLATLCLEYLTFPCFESRLSEQQRKDFAKKGFYAFQDYAISKWFWHIAFLVRLEKAEELTIDESKSENFAEVLDRFANRYEDINDGESLSSSTASDSSQPDPETKARDECINLKGRPFYDDLLKLWIRVSRHEKDTENRNKSCLKELEKVLQDNRKVIEELGETKGRERPPELEEFYGKNLFKCPRTRCDYFHEGLKDEKQREKHLNRHDRPFSCLDPQCRLGQAGFSSNKDLEKHRKNYHPDETTSYDPYPLRNNRQSSEANHVCKICQKRFTRKINLDGHTRSHFGDRPYGCQACNKKFTRLNDMRRHEKIHLRR